MPYYTHRIYNQQILILLVQKIDVSSHADAPVQVLIERYIFTSYLHIYSFECPTRDGLFFFALLRRSSLLRCWAINLKLDRSGYVSVEAFGPSIVYTCLFSFVDIYQCECIYAKYVENSTCIQEGEILCRVSGSCMSKKKKVEGFCERQFPLM